MSTSRTVISLQNISRVFSEITAVDDVSLSLGEGEFFALLGPSGCGKTTLLRIIAGFEKPDRGRVMLDGAAITGVRPNRRPINMMFQSYALFPHMTVAANVAFGLEMERLPRSEIRGRVTRILDKTRLTELATRKPAQLSGGQRQRVALARAIVKEPRVLLLDEPLGALDKKLREEMQIELKRLQNELGITFVVVTHDQEEALVMADRIALMEGGKVVQVDTPRTLYDHPCNPFVADFIGESNFIPGTITPHGLVTDSHGILPTAGSNGLPDDSQAVLLVRPERLVVSEAPPLDDGPAVQGAIEGIAYHGQNVKLLLRVADVERSLTATVSAAEADRQSFAAGTRVWCSWPVERGWVLPADDSQSITN